MDLCASGVPTTAEGGNKIGGYVTSKPPAEYAGHLRASGELNQTCVDYPREKCLHEVLTETAGCHPSKTAVEFRDKTLTYAELESRSNQLARFLQQHGVGPEALVGLCVERSLEMVIALLGILKAGGAYVPLDPAYPADRIKYVLDDARVRVLLTQRSLKPSLPVTQAEIVCVDEDEQSFAGEDDSAVSSETGPENLAYVIYTSGSTGKPKGVLLEHRSVVNFLYSMRRQPGMTAGDVLVAVTTLSFDIAGLELYLPLLTGGRLVIAPQETARDGRLLMQLMAASGATIMQATPTTWRVLFESGWSGDRNLKVLVGGEALPAELARQLAHSCGPVWNMYGPTETTIWSSVYRVEGKEERLVPIGKPIANTSFHILDIDRQPVAAGDEGELYIGGEGLARGYFERAEMTAEKFLPDPFTPVRTGRMYRTGDLVRYRSDGNVEFLGRIDHQVKIRGFRVELGEIESVLEQHPQVNQAVVVAREDIPGERRLIAYYVPGKAETPTTAELRQHLSKQLPDYMVPSAFIGLAKFPLTPNGKVDRKDLPAATVHDFEAPAEYVGPRNETERQMVRLWEEILGISPVGVTSNFFALGGRSVLAARLFTKILRTFGKELPLSTLFRSPTIAELAKELTPASHEHEYPTLVAIQPNGTKPPFFCVHGGAGSTLFLHQLAHRLGADQPFFGLEPEGMDGRPFQRPTVEEMAQYYLAEVRKLQPSGPYYLGGYCFGGLVAFEMARRLKREGERAELVVLFSAALRFNGKVVLSPQNQLERAPLGARIAKAIVSPIKTGKNLVAALYWRAVPMARKVAYLALFNLGRRVPPEMRAMYVTESLGRAEAQYRPMPYSGTLALFHGEEAKEYGPNLGWDGLADHFEHFVIGDGNLDSRRDIMNEPLVEVTAERLTACLNRISAAQTSRLFVPAH